MADKNIKIALILAATDKASAVLGKAFANAEKHAKSMEKTGKAIGEIADKGMVAGAVMTAFFGKTVQDARESAVASNRLEQVFRSMGKTTEEAAKHAEDFASSLQFEIGVEDEDIMAVQAKLATFQSLITTQALNVGIFNRAAQVAFDMQATGFGDAAGAAVQLGKALEDPIKGITALRKSGITFSEAERNKIKYLVQSNRQLQAQEIILKAVEKQVGGVARATADPVKRMTLQLGEASESIGKSLLPEVNKLADQTAAYLPRVIAFVENNKALVIGAAKGAAALLAFSASMKVVSFAFSGVSSAFRVGGGIIKGVNTAITTGGRIATFAVKGYDSLKYGMFALQYGMKFTVIPALKAAGTSIMQFGATLLASPITWYVLAAVALGPAVYFIIKNWDKISAFFARLWQNIKNLFTRFWSWFKNSIFIYFYPPLLIFKYWDKIAPFFRNLWENVKAIFTGVWKWVVDLHVKFYDAGKNIVMSIWRGMKALITKPVETMAEMTKKMREYLPFSPAKAGALKDIHKIKLVETIAQSITAKPLLNAMDNVTSRLYNQMQRAAVPPPAAAAGGGSMQINFSPTINLNGGATEADARMITDRMKSEFLKLIRDFHQQKQRVSFNS